MRWLNEPAVWEQDADIRTIRVEADARTDFWRKTHDGGVRDNGHFYSERAGGNFSLQVKVNAQYRDQYDQAGLMIRADESTWLKCGIEYVDGVQLASVVVTRDWSDWSVVPLPDVPATFWRVERHGTTFEIQYSLDGKDYTKFRQAYLTDADEVDVGVMACAPLGSGFPVSFERFEVSTENAT